jgi:hypothetical protein
VWFVGEGSGLFSDRGGALLRGIRGRGSPIPRLLSDRGGNRVGPRSQARPEILARGRLGLDEAQSADAYQQR